MKRIATIALVLALAATATADEGSSATPADPVELESAKKAFVHANLAVVIGDKDFGTLTRLGAKKIFGDCIFSGGALKCGDDILLSFDAVDAKLYKITFSAPRSAYAKDYQVGSLAAFTSIFKREWDEKAPDNLNRTTKWVWKLDGKVATISASRGVPTISYERCWPSLNYPCPK